MNIKSNHIGFQFFAEPGDNPNNPVNNPNNPPADNGQNNQNQPGEKTFTQSQVNAMAANEKKTARQALLKELGFEVNDDQSIKKAIASAKQSLDSTRSQSEIDATARKNAETAQQEAEAKVIRLQMEVEVMKSGVNPEYLDDVIALAMTKVSETNTLDKVLADMKTKYPVFFGSAASNGTGNPTNPSRKQTPNATDGLGKRLATASKSSVKSSYFKN